MNSNVQDILNRLEKVKSTADNQWTSLCPAHEDKNPSLSIKLADDDKVLLYCHAGCDHKDVVAAMGLSMKDLFPLSSAAPVKKNSIVLATYD
jgi:DNA primase